MTQTINKEQTKQDPKNPIVQFKVDGQDVILSPQIIKDYLTKGQEITLPEFKMFTALCKGRGLNPFLNEAYIIKYNNSPATIVVSKDVFLKRANNNPNYDGKENGIITRDKDTGELTNRDGAFCPKEDEIVGGWCKVYRKDRKYAEYVSVSVEECAKKTKEGKLNTNWINQLGTMIEKVAISRALRNAFPDEFTGMYIEEEMQQQQNVEPQEVQKDPFDNKVEESNVAEVIDVEPVVAGDTKEVDINNL